MARSDDQYVAIVDDIVEDLFEKIVEAAEDENEEKIIAQRVSNELKTRVKDL